MVPLFKSTFSLGRSILTLDPPDKVEEGGPDSIFAIAQEGGLKELFLVEDSMSGFLKAFRRSQDLGISLRFGWRLWCCNDVSAPKTKKKDTSRHKIVVFALNDQGCRSLYKLHTEVETQSGGSVDSAGLKKAWTDDLLLAIPFYDSFLFQNTMNFANCVPDFSFTDPVFFVEDNKLPFDPLVADKVRATSDNVQEAKSIFYKRRCDAEALQTYKIACNRSFGRMRTLETPNLSHFGSREFCWEAFSDQS